MCILCEIYELIYIVEERIISSFLLDGVRKLHEIYRR